MVAAASERMSSTRREPVSTISLKERAKQVVADKHGGLVVPEKVGRGPPAPLRAFVDDVVVQKRGGVDELDGGGEAVVILAPVAKEIGGGEGQHGADTLAAGVDEVGGYFGDAGGVFRRHAFADQGIDRDQVIRESTARQGVRAA